MVDVNDLRHGFLVGILQDPAGSQELAELFEADRRERGEGALLRSGPAATLTPRERDALNDQTSTLCFVAIDLATGEYIGYLSAHLVTTRTRGSKVWIEDVVTHPKWEGRGVGKALMVIALLKACKHWRARKAVLTSRSDRFAARDLYCKLGFQQKGEDQFELTFDHLGRWSPPAAAKLRYWGSPDEGDIISVPMRHAIMRICAGEENHSSWGTWTVVAPLGVIRYKDAPS